MAGTKDNTLVVKLFRQRLDAYSGAGQLIRFQADGLTQAGLIPEIYCERGALKFWLRTGRRARRVSSGWRTDYRPADGEIVVDHAAVMANPSIVFVHGLATLMNEHLPRPESASEASRENGYFPGLGASIPIVANSCLVAEALEQRFRIERKRISVIYPGIADHRFDSARRQALRVRARRSLGISDSVPLVGFVTSGDLMLRGIDIFLDAAGSMIDHLMDARFLVVGGHRIPESLRRHAIIESGRLIYMPKGNRPELWMAALDVFMHAGRFEAFGMAVAESLSLGIPVVASRRIGATELLPPVYDEWIAQRPDAHELAAKAAALLADRGIQTALRAAGVECAQQLTARKYAQASIDAMLGASRPFRSIEGGSC